MILAEKIQLLRKECGMSQEQLAEKCQVTRQSISKWESDIALPEVDKVLKLSEIFRVSIDTFLKDDLEVNSVYEVHTCGVSMERKDIGYFTGVLIKESIADEDILDYIKINKVEIWKTEGKPRYWTVLFFSSDIRDFPEKLSKVIKSEVSQNPWYCDFKSNNIKYIVLHNKVLNYDIGNLAQKESVLEQCKNFGIREEQMNWGE